MVLTDEQIKSILTKDVTVKTLLVNFNNADEVIQNHLKNGWELVKKIEINNKFKITFRKVK